MKGGAFSLIRRFREIVKPYLNNVARCSSDVVLFLTRHVLFCQVTCYNRFQTYLKSRVVLHPAGSLDLCQLCSLFLNCPDPNTLPHEAIAIQRKCQWLSTLTCILSQVICQLSNLLKTRFQGVLGVWVYTHIYIYMYVILYRFYIL